MWTNFKSSWPISRSLAPKKFWSMQHAISLLGKGFFSPRHDHSSGPYHYLQGIKSYCKTTHIEVAIKTHLFETGMHCWSKPGFGLGCKMNEKGWPRVGQWNLYKTWNMLTYHMIWEHHWMRTHEPDSSFNFTWNHLAFTLKSQSVAQHN